MLASLSLSATFPTPQDFGGSAAASLFGVSPPVRSGAWGGAANPIAHDATWARSAYNASHASLQVRVDTRATCSSAAGLRCSSCVPA